MEAPSPIIPGHIPEPARMSPSRTSGSFSSGLIPAPQVTASAWSIVNVETGDFLCNKNGDMLHDIASLTKMMTLYLVNQCIKKNLCNELDIVTVPKDAVLLGGTTAYLKANDQLTVIDLLYGMMLPSGNDAAYTLAQFCGNLMLKDPKNNKKKLNYESVAYFVKQMNSECRRLGFKNSKFLNPHGLSHLANQSTAKEIGRLGGITLTYS
jgi:serine-type D-Ala-D-Ala carboxypeptidase (penicillin-binding protein 5/6)